MTAVGDGYVPSRAQFGSSRLTAQHHLLCLRAGELLSSRILADKNPNGRQQLRIADVGCGNGIWAIEMSSQPTFQVVGLDISSELFPPRGTWPPNCSFEVFDVVETLPEQYVAAFDIIHVRLLAAGLHNTDGGPVAETLKLMLKSGGWIQWTDIAPPYVLSCKDSASWDATPLSIATQLPRLVTSLEWLGQLPELFEATGLTQVEHYQCRPDYTVLMHETDNFILALAEVQANSRPDEDFEGAVQEVHKYVGEGGLVTVALCTTIARKAVERRATF